MSDTAPQGEARVHLEDVIAQLDRRIHGEDYDPRRSKILAEALLASEGAAFTESELEELQQRYSDLDNN